MPTTCAEEHRLTLLYRGPLQSCNYGCGYCPFEHREETSASLESDRAALERLVGWVAERRRPTRVLLAPRGEALVHRHYQQALARLSRLPHLEKVAIQTNLSAPLSWLERCDASRLGVWATYHPGQARRRRFLDSCAELRRRGASLSVGLVGLREHLQVIEELRSALPAEVYLWINAFKRQPHYYRPDEIARLERVDPLFRFNLRPQPSRGLPCRTGHDVIAVDGAGRVTRCPFVDETRGWLYSGRLALDPAPRPCPADRCRCHIGYVHLEPLGLGRRFGEGLLERALPLSRGARAAE